jgi:SagB-type dehydrogenase family enzyme
MKSVLKNITYSIYFIFGFVFSVQSQDLKPVQLLPPDLTSGKSLMQSLNERKSSREFSQKGLPLKEISNLLWAANGINRVEEGKHTAPTARNWQDIDVYIMMKEGVFLYDPISSQLKPVASGDFRSSAGTQDYVATAPVNLVFVSDFSRMKNASEESKPLYAASDAAFIAQNVYLYCASAELAVVVRASLDKEKLANVLKLDSNQNIILAQTVGYPK